MEKKKIRAVAVLMFGVLLGIQVLAGSGEEQSGLGQLRDAMRNLKRVNNLQMTYAYSVSQNETTTIESAEIWADMLTGCWVCEYYMTDEDGTRPYLKQFCDGTHVYTYDEWTGEWELAQDGDSSAVPGLSSVTTLDYSAGDIWEAEMQEKDGQQWISYTFTQEYLEEKRDAQVSEVETAYASYQKSGASPETLDIVEVTVEQYKQMRYEDVAVTYTIDAGQVLKGMEYTARLVMPEIVTDAAGASVLGKEQETQLMLRVDIERYDENGIVNKIEQCRNQVIAEME